MYQQSTTPWRRIASACLSLAVVVAGISGSVHAASLKPKYVMDSDGRTANFDFSKHSDYDAPINIRKTVTGLDSDERDFQLYLSATGYDEQVTQPQDIYAVFVMDATSSMGHEDIPTSAAEGNIGRRDAAKKALKAYVDAFFSTYADPNIRKHVAVVSFGNGARIHVPASSGLPLVNSTCPEGGHFIGLNNYSSDAESYYGQAEALFANVRSTYGSATSRLFFDSADTVKAIIDDIPKYSNTNIQSGVLAADFLLANVDAGSARKYTFLVSDGEANSSSTIAMLEQHPDLDRALKLGASLGTSGSEESFSMEAVMDNLAGKVTDEGFVRRLKDIDNKDINFFAGNFSNVDRNESHNGAEKTIHFDTVVSYLPTSFSLGASNYAKPVTYAVKDTRTPTEFYREVDAYAKAALEAGKWSAAGLEQYNYFLLTYAKHLFWMDAQKCDQVSIGHVTRPATDVFGNDSHGHHIAFDQLFPHGKPAATRLCDYQEHTSYNVNGSPSAKVFMRQAADHLKQATGSTVFTVAIGGAILYEDEISPVASDPDKFMLCNKTADIYNTAEKLSAEFERLGHLTGRVGIQNVTIHDVVPTRPAGNPEKDDDTFAVDESSFVVRWHYYKGGSPAVKEVPLTQATFAANGFSIDKSDAGAFHIRWNAGDLYSQELAREKQSANHVHKIELTFKVTANPGVYSAPGGIPDIHTNQSAEVTWGDSSEPKNTMPYPEPMVHLEPPADETTSENTSENTSETTGESTSEATEPSTEEKTTSQPTSTDPPATSPTSSTRPGGSSTPDQPTTAPTTQATEPTQPTIPIPTTSPDNPYPDNSGGRNIPDSDFTPIGDAPVPLAEIPNLMEIFDDGVPLTSLPQTGGARTGKAAFAGLLLAATGLLLKIKKKDD